LTQAIQDCVCNLGRIDLIVAPGDPFPQLGKALVHEILGFFIGAGGRILHRVRTLERRTERNHLLQPREHHYAL
jgi:hypothetical protein